MWWNPRCIRLLSTHCVIPVRQAQHQKLSGYSGYSTTASTAGRFLMSRFQSRRENSARTKFGTERKAFGNIQKLLLSQTLHSNIHCFIVCDLGVLPGVEGWTKPDCVEGLKQLMSVGFSRSPEETRCHQCGTSEGTKLILPLRYFWVTGFNVPPLGFWTQSWYIGYTDSTSLRCVACSHASCLQI